MSTDIHFDGFDKVMLKIRKVAPHLRYIVVDEVFHRKRSQCITKMTFDPATLAPYLVEEPEPTEASDDEDTSDDPTEAGDEDQDDDLGDLAAATSPPLSDELGRLCDASGRWLRHVAREFMAKRAACTFKVWLHSLKGEYLTSTRFFAENQRYRPPVIAPPGAEPTPPPPAPAAQLPAVLVPQLPSLAAPPPPPRPAPIFDVTQQGPAVALALGADGRGQLIYLDPESIPEARVWRALGRATEDLLGTMGRTVTGIVELQTRTVHHQAGQLDKSQQLIENLAMQLLAARQIQQSSESEQKVDERQLRVREELGKTFLSELGSLGRLLASSKMGVAPELAELGDLIAASPELTEAVRDPEVRALLKDEKTTRELAQLLRLAARRSGSGGGSPPPQAA